MLPSAGGMAPASPRHRPRACGLPLCRFASSSSCSVPKPVRNIGADFKPPDRQTVEAGSARVRARSRPACGAVPSRRPRWRSAGLLLPLPVLFPKPVRNIGADFKPPDRQTVEAGSARVRARSRPACGAVLSRHPRRRSAGLLLPLPVLFPKPVRNIRAFSNRQIGKAAPAPCTSSFTNQAFLFRHWRRRSVSRSRRASGGQSQPPRTGCSN